jgi:hypothetical protein
LLDNLPAGELRVALLAIGVEGAILACVPLAEQSPGCWHGMAHERGQAEHTAVVVARVLQPPKDLGASRSVNIRVSLS